MEGVAHLNKVYKKAIQIVKKAGKLYYKKPYEVTPENNKYANDVVTNNDVLTQQFLVKHLAKLLPSCDFIGEEKLNGSGNCEYVWIMDPIDGTYNYTRNVELYGTQVALQKNGRTVFSVLHLPALKQTYYAFDGKSYCNGKPIQTSPSDQARSVVLNIYLHGKQKVPFTSETLNNYLKNKKMRIFGSSLYDFALVASGKTDCILINSSSAWDIEPGLLLAQNAGAKVLHLKEHHLMIVAGNNKILNDIEKNLKLIDPNN